MQEESLEDLCVAGQSAPDDERGIEEEQARVQARLQTLSTNGEEQGADAGPLYEWQDITSDFFEAIKELSLGELMHHRSFGLFEAMSAIEMMDPKMDAGMICNKNSPQPLTFLVALQTNQIKVDDLSYSELIGIIDGIFSCLVSWLEGHSLAQSLFTCLYVHHPNYIKDQTLRSFCWDICILTQIIRKFVIHAMVYEEEDFQSNPFDFSLFPHEFYDMTTSMIKEAEEELIKKSKLENAAVEEIQAVICRLKFLRFLLQSLVSLWPEHERSLTENDLTEINWLLNSALELVPSMKKTIHLGTQPEPDSDSPNPMGFSPMVNQRLLPPTFPRYTKIKDRLTCITFLEDLVQRLKLASKVIHCVTYHSALNFFMDFSKKSGNCLLSRSVLQCLYRPVPNKVFGVTLTMVVLKESAKAFIAPPALMPQHPLSSHPMAKECVDAFFCFSVNMHTFVMFLQICGYNRARQRDKLARLFFDLAHLQDKAARVDACLHPLAMKTEPYRQHLACFGTWVLYHCLRAMCLFLLSGLELELYSVHEYLYIFWYLYEFLFGWVVSALTRADSFLMEHEALLEQTKHSSKQRKPKAKKRKVKPYCREIMFNQAMQNMSGGYYKGLAAFYKEDRIPQPMAMFDNEKVRFSHRFAPFSNLTTPPPVAYADFKKMRAHLLKSPSSELYLMAATHFHQARTILEAIANPDQEMNDILRVAKINFVVMNLLAKGHKKDSKTPPEFNFSLHRYFPIINY